MDEMDQMMEEEEDYFNDNDDFSNVQNERRMPSKKPYGLLNQQQ
jgi:hypothetical protein